jgi:GrpB-like predicted nucleotidyltransferase (UPF0157 family)
MAHPPDAKPPTEPATEAQIASYTIGELQAHNDSIHLASYDPAWPKLYERQADRIRCALGNGLLGLEHVGSTSVPDLAAKPCIDIVLVVKDSSDEPAYVPQLESVGYVLRIREPDWHQHRMFKGPDTNLNLHVFSSGCTEVDRMIAFRDRIRSHPEDRMLYETTKRALAQRRWKYIQNYADAKTEVVERILRRAMDGRGPS